MDHEEQKETLYFLEWIAHESGFTEDQILENMMPANQKWDDLKPYTSIEEYHKFRKYDNNEFIYKLFNWPKSFLEPSYDFWYKIHKKIIILVNSNNYNIEFSRYPIKNWKVVKPPKKVKVKSKLKI